MTCEVLRPFDGADGRKLETGEIVDTTGWLWTEHLIRNGYLRIVDPKSPRAQQKRGT